VLCAFLQGPLELCAQPTELMGLYSEPSFTGLIEAAAFHKG
jgi:hypothetical protein